MSARKRKISSLAGPEIPVKALKFLNPFYLHKDNDPQKALEFLDGQKRQQIKTLKAILSEDRHVLSIPPDAKKIDLLKTGRYSRIWEHTPSRAQEKQKSQAWLESRRGVITGSKLASFLGFHGLSAFLKTFYETYLPDQQLPLDIQEEEIDKFVSQERMDAGNFHEIDAIATFAHTFAEAFDLDIQESLQITVKLPDELMNLIRKEVTSKYKRKWDSKEQAIWENFIRDSPDLQGTYRALAIRWVLEIKTKKRRASRQPETPDIIKEHYIPQMLAHSLAVNTEGTLFEGWGPEEARFQYVPQNMTFWKLAIPNLVWVHIQGLTRSVPDRLYDPQLTKELKNLCSKISKEAKSREIAAVHSVFSARRDEDYDVLKLVILISSPLSNEQKKSLEESYIKMICEDESKQGAKDSLHDYFLLLCKQNDRTRINIEFRVTELAQLELVPENLLRFYRLPQISGTSSLAYLQ